MKRILTLTLIALFVAAPVFADGQAPNETTVKMGDKLVRGVKNLFTGIFEVPYQIGKGYSKGVDAIENKALSKTVGTVLGVFRGFSHAAGRSFSGATEIFGFWTANEPSVYGIPLDAEMAWEEGTQYSIFKPTLGEGLKPVWKKLGHGLANGFLGIAELPGQIKKGADQGHIGAGAVKGIWYWFSREAYGLSQAVTFLLPAPAQNVGPMFEEEMPWDALSSE